MIVGQMFPSEEKYGPRLNMYLCHCSSEEADYPAVALRDHTIRSLGWQSSKMCVYPQELGLRFEGEVELQYIRVLSHESKIMARIEVFVADVSEEEARTNVLKSYESSTFYRLGYVHFSPADNCVFGVRELKTIKVRRKCVYVKLLFSRPHRSEYNVFQQVGIIAMTGHGTLIRTFQSGITRGICLIGETVEVPLDEMSPPVVERCEITGSEDENSPKMDPATMRRIREVSLMKERAVVAEDYDLAAVLKSCLDSLQSAGKEIFELDRQKAVAVRDENYALAKVLKHQIDELRGRAYRIPATSANRKSTFAPPSDVVRNVPSPQSESSLQPQPPPKTLDTFRAAPTTTTAIAPTAFDETPVGGLGFYPLDDLDDNRGSRGMNSDPGDAGVDVGGGDAVAVKPLGDEEWERGINQVVLQLSGNQACVSPLVRENLAEAKAAEKTFGIYCTSCLFGKKGKLCEAAIRAIVSPAGFAALSAHSNAVLESLLCYMALPSRGVSDSFTGVVLACCEALSAIIEGNVQNAPSLSSLMPHLTPLLPHLVSRSGDNNSRIREAAISVLSSISEFALEPVVSVLLVDPEIVSKRPCPYRVHVMRMKMLGSLVDIHGADGTRSIDLEAGTIVTKALMRCLSHSNNEVREAASLLFAKLMLVAPKRVGTHLNSLKAAQRSIIEEYIMDLKGVAPTLRPPVNVETSARPFSAAHSEKGEANSGKSPCPPNPRDTEDYHAVRTCYFCGEFNENFSDAALDMHFIRGCPMLCPCPLCDQITEISTLQQHLTSECDKRHLVRECPMCKEAVRVEDLKSHINARSCINAVPTHSVCPLCHARFHAGAAGWVAHLASPPGCPNNPRKYDGTGPIRM